MVDGKQIAECPNCQAKIRVGNPGQTYRCPKCQTTFRPAAAQSAAVSAKPKPPLQPPAAKPTSAVRPAVVKPPQVVPQVSGDLFGSELDLPASTGHVPMQIQPTTAPKPIPKGTNPKPRESKLNPGIVIAISIGCGLILCVGLGFAALALLPPPKPQVVPEQVAATPPPPEQPPLQLPATEENWVPSKPGAIVYKPGDSLGPKSEGSGPRTALLGKAMQANEVRTIMWRIVTAYPVAKGERLAAGEQAMRPLPGYIQDSLTIDETNNIVSLKYKGIELIGHDYRKVLELATELNLDPRPRFE